MILILGKSSLAEEIKKIIPSSVIIGRPEYDFSFQQDCDTVISNYNPTVLINTVGVIDENIWNSLITNYVSMVYLTTKFYEKMSAGHIINVGSASSFWPSYPNINTKRFIYNLSKESVNNFNKHFNRKIIDDSKKVTVSLLEPGRFPSKINNYTNGIDIKKVSNLIKIIIDNNLTEISMIK